METIAPNEQRQQNGFVPKISGGRKGGCFIAPKLGDAAIKDLIARQGPSPFLNVDPNAKARIGKILHAENVDEYQMEAFWRGIEESRPTFSSDLYKKVSGTPAAQQAQHAQQGPQAMDEGDDNEESETGNKPAFASGLTKQLAERGQWEAPPVDPTVNIHGQHVPLPPRPVDPAKETVEQSAKRLFAAPQKQQPKGRQQQQQDDAMDTSEDTTSDNPVSRASKMDVRPASGPLLEVFKRIDDLVANISPLGFVTEHGTKFQLIAPPQGVDERISQKLPDMSLLMKAAERTYSHEVDMIIIHSHISACPIHVSPLLLYCNRQVDACMRFTDAITLASRLHYLRKAIHELDTKDKPFKKQCDTNRVRLEFRVAGDFWEAVDTIVQLGRIPMGQRQGPYANDNRSYFSDLVTRFANEWVRYTRRYIAVQEFCILSMCRIPYAYFAPLMTPKLTPPASAAFSDPMDPGFAVLRTNMCSVLRARNKYFCGKYSAAVDPDTGKYIYMGIDPKAWMPMRLNDGHEGEGGYVRIEDRLIKLGKYEGTPVPPEYHDKCMFGVYQDWIDLHTLREVLMFLSNDDRRKKVEGPALPALGLKESVSEKNNRGRMRPVLTEAEEAAADRAAKALEQERAPDRKLVDMSLPEESI